MTDTNSPTPPQGEIEQQILAWQDKYLVRINKTGHANDALDELVTLITAQVQAAEARARRDLGMEIHRMTDPFLRDPLHERPMAQAIRLVQEIDGIALAALKEPNHE